MSSLYRESEVAATARASQQTNQVSFYAVSPVCRRSGLSDTASVARQSADCRPLFVQVRNGHLGSAPQAFHRYKASPAPDAILAGSTVLLQCYRRSASLLARQVSLFLTTYLGMCGMMTFLPQRALYLVCAVLLVALSPPSAVTAEGGQSENRIRVAVMNFENNSTWSYWGDDLGYAVADELVTQLFGTGQFSLVERSQLESVLAEQNLGQSGLVNPTQAAEIGRLLGVQLILTGSITRFSIDTKGGGFGGFQAEYSEAESSLDIRLIDTTTAEIMFADDGEGKVRLGGFRIKGVNFRQDFDVGLAQEALRPAVEDAVKKIVAKADIFSSVQVPVSPAQIVGAADGGNFYIDKGENYGVVVGQRYRVLRVVDEIRDANGNLLDRITEAVGMLEVTRVLGQSAISTVVEGEAAEGDSLEPVQ
jgi:curli biogenesis system outer membrane secretion channel CsgG